MTAWESFLGSSVEGRALFKERGFRLPFLNLTECQHHPFMLFLQTGETKAAQMLPDRWCDVGVAATPKGTGGRLRIMSHYHVFLTIRDMDFM